MILGLKEVKTWHISENNRVTQGIVDSLGKIYIRKES
jgi:hypothetical protein